MMAVRVGHAIAMWDGSKRAGSEFGIDLWCHGPDEFMPDPSSWARTLHGAIPCASHAAHGVNLSSDLRGRCRLYEASLDGTFPSEAGGKLNSSASGVTDGGDRRLAGGRGDWRTARC